jgi:hypothetical protein
MKLQTIKQWIANAVIAFSLLLTFQAYGQCPGAYWNVSGFTVDPTKVNPVTFDYLGTNPILFDCDMIITTGTKCRFNSITIKFTPGHRIIVQRGAYLEVHHSIVTACNPIQLWKGIQVYGTNNASQVKINPSFPSQYIFNLNDSTGIPKGVQGIVLIDSGSEISRAEVGVLIGDYSVSAYNGGILRATNSSFSDCKYGVRFMPYQDPRYKDRNFSYFQNCAFSWWDPTLTTHDTIYADPSINFYDIWAHLEALVELNGVHGVIFAGGNIFTDYCTLTQITSGANSSQTGLGIDYVNDTSILAGQYTMRGEGIRAISSSFYLIRGEQCKSDKYPFDGTSCAVCDGRWNEFNNLFIGINAINHGATVHALVSGSKFMDNHNCINFKKYQNVYINRDSFGIDNNYPTYNDLYDPIGIGLDSCSNLDVSDNTLHFHLTIQNQVCYTTQGAGIVVRGSAGSSPNRIYKNWISMNIYHVHCTIMEWGLWLINDNSHLDIQCNTFHVQPTIGGSDWMIQNLKTGLSHLKDQGSVYLDAGNQFSPNCNSGFTPLYHISFYNWPTYFNYYFYNIDPYIPHCIDSLITSGGWWHIHFWGQNDQSNQCHKSSFCKPFEFIEDTTGWHKFGDTTKIDSDIKRPFGWVELMEGSFEKDYQELGIQDKFLLNGEMVKIYPNPSSGFVIIDYNLPSNCIRGKISLYDINGKEIKSNDLNVSVGSYNIDLTNLPKGLYLLKILSKESEIYSRKLILQ